VRRVITVVAVALAFLLLRSFVLPAGAPTWLRGTSPFNALDTRAERRHCVAFADMIGSTNPGYTIYGDRNDGPIDVSIDRTLRVHDSLVFEGKASRGGRTRLLFHCATASRFGHPGEHKTAASSPWPGTAEDWESANRLEEKMEEKCAALAVAAIPNSAISRRWLVLRPLPGRGDIQGTALDTLTDDERDFSCVAWTYEPGTSMYQRFGDFSVELTSPTRDNPGPGD